jgi:selenocysteine lyase/cysteine desulfurase
MTSCATEERIVRPIPPQRDLFDVPDGVAYFNVASLAPSLRSAVAAGEEALRWRGQPWRIRASDWFTAAERRRSLFAELVGATVEEVALVPTTSYGLGVAALNLSAGRGDRVLVLADEYPSGVYTWRRFARRTGAEILTVRREQGQTWTESVLASCDERVAVVSVPQVHWTDGSLVDLDAVAGRAREIGAALVVDASQSAGVMPLDVATLDPDFLVTVGYKWLLGPFALGYLYVAERHREGTALEDNWIVRDGSDDFARLVDYRDEYQPGARRFDAGGRTHFELTPMAVVALEQLLAWGVADIAASLRDVTGRLAREARTRGLEVPADHGPHMLGIRVPDEARDRITRALSEAGVFVGPRGNALRVSPHLHTTDEDIDRLLGSLDTVM